MARHAGSPRSLIGSVMLLSVSAPWATPWSASWSSPGSPGQRDDVHCCDFRPLERGPGPDLDPDPGRNLGRNLGREDLGEDLVEEGSPLGVAGGSPYSPQPGTGTKTTPVTSSAFFSSCF